jgi:isopenicillin-N N-acyltransferase like protein
MVFLGPSFLRRRRRNPDAAKDRPQHSVHDFRGTPFEIGRQHGKALGRQIRLELTPYLKWAAQKQRVRVEACANALVSRYEGLFRERMPGVLEEIEGIAEGARLSYPYAFVAAVRDMMPIDGCTAIACGAGANSGGPLIGQTRDVYGAPRKLYIMRVRYASGRSMVLLNYPGWIANTGITSNGLAFAAFSLYGVAPQQPTAPGSFLKRLVLEARSTAEVLDAIRGMSFPNGGFLIGDRAGHVAAIEMVAGKVCVRDVSGRAVGYSNVVSTAELKAYETASEDASSEPRQARIGQMLAEGAGAISVEFMQSVFRDHSGFPLSICRHHAPTDTWATRAAFVADLKAGEMHIAIGNPCVAPFVRYSLAA